ncbi:MAG: FAD-dependent monooxygenase [Oligoflexia bacterium]|nr:FAD-dependent monooxygenase [Oligoflexia bacterium]
MAESILIGGGGIAGLALGISLKLRGFDPLIIEKEARIRPQIKGEYFQPRGVLDLIQLDLLDDLLEAGAIRIEKISHCFNIPFSDRVFRFEVKYPEKLGVDFGLAISHERILEVFWNKYISLGGRSLRGENILQISQSHSGHFIKLASGNIIEGDLFVGADGRYSPSSKMLGMERLDLSCDRVMMATIIKEDFLSEGEFYTEALPQGVVYAFKVEGGLTRAYLCVRKELFSKSSHDRETMLTRLLELTKLNDGQRLEFVGPTMAMPTVDSFLIQRSKLKAIWIGDAAGTVDPLGGHGMNLALQNAIAVSKGIESHLHITDSKKFTHELAEIGNKSHDAYFHARFMGTWISLLFMDHGILNRIAKWKALSSYNANPDRKRRVAGLFGGTIDEAFDFLEVPYLLGIIPTSLRNKIMGFYPLKNTRRLQNNLVTRPLEFDRKLLKRKAIAAIENLF